MARIDLISPHAPVNAATRLKAAMEGVTPDSPQCVLGSGTEHDMTLWVHRPNFRNDMKTRLIATMEPHAGGTRIRGRLGGPRSVFVFFGCWFGFVSLFLVIGLTMLAASFAEGLGLHALMFVVVPIFMLAVGGFILWVGSSHARSDRAAILAFLHQTLATRPFNPRDL
ncbi:hypothetical protein [Sphingomonas sp.]|jgi:hypothetical protein|uniref:hypothetical protein n=1 Tax=Sphingomonas sp. TaxID=28214 RepID=UPI002E111CA1|nr:hypothetical protein [Sphingomonas sp.]